MALSPFEKVLAFYYVLDRHIESLPSQCAIFPHQALTSFVLEKEALLRNKRAKDPSYLVDEDAQRWLSLDNRVDARNALAAHNAWRQTENYSRDSMRQNAKNMLEENSISIVQQFAQAAKNVAHNTARPRAVQSAFQGGFAGVSIALKDDDAGMSADAILSGAVYYTRSLWQQKH